ncbi:MAG: type IV toxin-antitoxin system AbiEi family antitoxin domain-containing protein, partial [Actinomycetia bacterium]|nr:type IV toxin-antitoxin system AbiEi family antitoxin domain-containing protein [Actinomycetes bacterium]
LLSDIADAQKGYFTRAQAIREGVDDMRLQRAVNNGSIERLDHGVYRITGAGQDPHQALRVAWLRLAPGETPRQRTRRPHLWVSHRSAARLLDLGVVAADVPEFISDRRIQTGADVIVRVRSGGLERSDWMIHDGFVVTTPARTVADLAADRMDGGHLGRIASDALERGMTSRHELELAVAGKVDIASIIEQATGKAL